MIQVTFCLKMGSKCAAIFILKRLDSEEVDKTVIDFLSAFARTRTPTRINDTRHESRTNPAQFFRHESPVQAHESASSLHESGKIPHESNFNFNVYLPHESTKTAIRIKRQEHESRNIQHESVAISFLNNCWE